MAASRQIGWLVFGVICAWLLPLWVVGMSLSATGRWDTELSDDFLSFTTYWICLGMAAVPLLLALLSRKFHIGAKSIVPISLFSIVAYLVVVAMVVASVVFVDTKLGPAPEQWGLQW